MKQLLARTSATMNGVGGGGRGLHKCFADSTVCPIFDDQLARKSAQSADVAAVTNVSDMSARAAIPRYAWDTMCLTAWVHWTVVQTIFMASSELPTRKNRIMGCRRCESADGFDRRETE